MPLNFILGTLDTERREKRRVAPALPPDTHTQAPLTEPKLPTQCVWFALLLKHTGSYHWTGRWIDFAAPLRAGSGSRRVSGSCWRAPAAHIALSGPSISIDRLLRYAATGPLPVRPERAVVCLASRRGSDVGRRLNGPRPTLPAAAHARSRHGEHRHAAPVSSRAWGGTKPPRQPAES